MNKRLIGSMLLALMLAACSTKPVKTAPAPTEDKSPSASQAAPAAKDDSASTAGMAGADASANPLKDPNNILSKRSIYFDYDKDEVKSEFRPLIEAHAKYLQAHPEAKMFLQGNADERGAREYNLSLGQRRAVSVKKVLNLLGVQDKQIETVSFGEERAHAGCRDDSCYAQDRRVDVVYENE
ncbi:MAG TPA: peptidoglycan-associated lipoprotein Pal [Methylophilaceae bacterium]|nr:peptidoglycan-associated lipoprotein Pal [Methylophilaceae bacterium]